MTKILEFNLGSEDRAWLKLRISGRERPDATEADDRTAKRSPPVKTRAS